MKKISTLCSVVFLFSIFCQSLSAQVAQSRNVVGTVNIDASNPFTMIGNPFNPLNGGYNVNNIIGNQMTGGVSIDDGDNFWSWENSGYERFFLVDFPSAPQHEKWVDQDLMIAKESFYPGKGAFIKNVNVPKTIRHVGEVIEGGVAQIEIIEGFNMLSHPFNAPFELNGSSHFLRLRSRKMACKAGSQRLYSPHEKKRFFCSIL